MFIAEVVGTVWGTAKHPSLKGRRLLLVRPIEPLSGKPCGAVTMAVEGGVGAGPGSVVLVLDEGSSARQVLKDEKAPVRAVVCGVLDSVATVGGSKSYA